ncbi:MAG: tetratricopeptide repeat protein, partial [Terriglobia bacterium]
AKELNREMPDDILVYGFLADAHAELGNYTESEDAAQWMLNMRPGNVPGLTRGAYLRELFGDIEGAIEFMGSAFQRTPPQEREDRAWILTHIAHLELSRGRVAAADQLLPAAFELFPDYHYALSQRAKVRTAQQRHAEAADLLRQLVQVAPNPENFYPLAEALDRAGRREEAQAAFEEFEQKALREVEWADNANRELIFYYADHARKPAEALWIAQKEFARRQDVYTLDAYAWALYVNGEYVEARQQIERALAVGIRDAKLFYHAGAITAKLNDRLAAEKYLRESLQLNPVSEAAAAAQNALHTLTSAAAAWREQEEVSGFDSL